jgi:hypothetical protein
MATLVAKLPTIVPVQDAKKSFESALAVMGRTVSENSRRSSGPIRGQRILQRPADPANEKRALADAARALAQLWKLPSSVGR